MRVLVLGGTGVIGRVAVPTLLAQGHDVRVLARNAQRCDAVRALGAEPVVGDLFDPEAMATALRGQEAVLNLATRVPTGSRVTRPSAWREHDRVRGAGSTVLVDAALRTGTVRTLVQEGISLIYADGGDEVLDENAALDVPSIMDGTQVAAVNAARFAAEGRTGVALRIAMIFGDDASSRALVSLARRGGPAMLGSPRGWTTAIHPDDVGAAVVAALRAPSGIYNVGANPVRRRGFGAVIANAAGARKVRGVPDWLMRRAGSLSVLGRSHRLSSAKFTNATGWRPRHPEPTGAWLG
ncbi:NAD-dependent epimerase/dehydratase family protein [Allokutzneria oryzae]|uniref:NAD-dependent epimerase/dehydratase family protein n=1 Tax=Allokutzneria oryzae TaxID=1378989 RepID=A0ABV5ZX80_9PSEU